MGHSKPQLTRALASDLTDLKHVAELVDHNGSTGVVSFNLADDECLSAGRVSRLLPDGWMAVMVATPGPHTSVYVQPE